MVKGVTPNQMAKMEREVSSSRARKQGGFD
jgi:hypothetical protein